MCLKWQMGAQLSLSRALPPPPRRRTAETGDVRRAAALASAPQRVAPAYCAAGGAMSDSARLVLACAASAAAGGALAWSLAQARPAAVRALSPEVPPAARAAPRVLTLRRPLQAQAAEASTSSAESPKLRCAIPATCSCSGAAGPFTPRWGMPAPKVDPFDANPRSTFLSWCAASHPHRARRAARLTALRPCAPQGRLVRAAAALQAAPASRGLTTRALSQLYGNRLPVFAALQGPEEAGAPQSCAPRARQAKAPRRWARAS